VFGFEDCPDRHDDQCLNCTPQAKSSIIPQSSWSGTRLKNELGHSRIAGKGDAIRHVGCVGQQHAPRERICVGLEPTSKSFEEDNEAGKLDKAEEIVGVILPANEDPALPLNPSEEALNEPAPHVAA
jgi:hypothetical protein